MLGLMLSYVPTAYMHQGLDLILFLYGIKLNTTSDVEKTCNLLARIIVDTFLYLSLISFVIVSVASPGLLQPLVLLFKYILLIAMHHCYSLQRESILSILQRVSSNKEQEHQGDVKQDTFGSKCVKVWLFFSTLSLIVTSRVVSFDGASREALVNSIVATVLVNILLVLINTGWPLISLLLIVYIYNKVNDEDERIHYDGKEILEARQTTSDSLDQLREQWTQLQEVKKKVNSTLGFISGLWLILMSLELISMSVTVDWRQVAARSLHTVFGIGCFLFVANVTRRTSNRANCLLGLLQCTENESSTPLGLAKMSYATQVRTNGPVKPRAFAFIPLNTFIISTWIIASAGGMLVLLFFIGKQGG